MSDPVSNHDIEDVLSSIRRLVAQGDPRRMDPPPTRAAPAPSIVSSEPVKAKPSTENPEPAYSDVGRLVLTPAFRVLTPEDKDPKVEASEPANGPVSADATTEEEVDQSLDERFDVNAKIEPKNLTERASLEAKIAALEAAVSGVNDDFEPDGSEVTGKPTLESSVLANRESRDDSPEKAGSSPEAALNDAVVSHIAATVADEIAGAFPNLNATETEEEHTVVQLNSARNTSAGQTKAAPVSQEAEEVEEEVVFVAPKIHKPAAFRKDPEPAAEPAKNEAPVSPKPEVEVVEPVTTDAPTFRHSARGVYDPVAEATADAAEAEADGDDIYGDELAPDPEILGTAVAETAAPAALMDPDMLRDMVGQMIREELQGEMGERITRNVRKLVRREINRVLSAQEFE